MWSTHHATLLDHADLYGPSLCVHSGRLDRFHLAFVVDVVVGVLHPAVQLLDKRERKISRRRRKREVEWQTVPSPRGGRSKDFRL